MKKIIIPAMLALVCLFYCCRKNDSPINQAEQDSLGTGWSKMTGSAMLTDICFVGSKGFGVGTKLIRSSNDEGLTWRTVLTTSQEPVNVSMGSSDNMIAVSTDKLFYTTNGGVSFDSANFSGEKMYDVFFVNAQQAYAMGKNFWMTQDGGKTWQEIYKFSNSSTPYPGLFFRDATNGWVSFQRNLYKTTDAGKTWAIITPELLKDTTVAAISCPAQSIGYVAAGKGIFKTTDEGLHWQNIFNATEQFIDIQFLDQQNGYCNTLNSIYKTADGGATWSKVVKAGTETDFIELHFVDVHTGYASGTSPMKYKH